MYEKANASQLGWLYLRIQGRFNTSSSNYLYIFFCVMLQKGVFLKRQSNMKTTIYFLQKLKSICQLARNE